MSYLLSRAGGASVGKPTPPFPSEEHRRLENTRTRAYSPDEGPRLPRHAKRYKVALDKQQDLYNTTELRAIMT